MEQNGLVHTTDLVSYLKLEILCVTSLRTLLFFFADFLKLISRNTALPTEHLTSEAKGQSLR